MQFLKKDSVEFDMTFIFKGKSFKLRTYHGFGTPIKTVACYSVFTQTFIFGLLFANGKKIQIDNGKLFI